MSEYDKETDRALDVVARMYATRLLDTAAFADDWEDYADVGMDDFREVIGRVGELVDGPTDVEYEAAYAHLASRAGALPHLTDDGATDTPPADSTGVGAPAAAESATTTAAPSSPHPTCSGHCYSNTESGAGYIDPKCAIHGEGATPATHRPTCGTTYGESCDGYCPTPAIDRKALAKLIAIRRWDASVPSTDLADVVIALIGAPNSGASEEDQ